MSVPKMPPAQRHVVPFDLYSQALQHSDGLGREMRMDSPLTQGIATGWFMESALRDGNLDLATRYARLERAEWQVVDRMFRQWVADILTYIEANIPSAADAIRLVRIPRQRTWDVLDGAATAAMERLLESLQEGRPSHVEDCHASLRELHVLTNDLYVEWIQDLLTTIAEHLGDEAVERATRESYDSVWKARYAGWFDMSAAERVALTCAGMRAHYGGPGRRGDFVVIEEPDRYVLSFDPCGTGGVLRRRAAGDDHHDHVAGNLEVQPWSWGLKNVPWYCSHCPLLLEHFPLQDYGRVMRPTEFSPDPHDPTRWVIFKD